MTRQNRPDLSSAARALIVLLCWLTIAPAAPVGAQSGPCGIVTSFDYPMDIADTLSARFDDFALFRRSFGGIHVGIDLGFNRFGEKVYAAARGQVTYSDPEGWGTEKGVVIIRHTFPDRSIAYTLYGHVEERDDLRLPRVGECLEAGDPVGVIGAPSRSRPHLHYEIRDFLPDDGGPGYVADNPLLRGWFHPLEFTSLWRLRLAGGYLGSVSFERSASLPPIVLENGDVVIASDDVVEAYNDRRVLWRVTLPGAAHGLAALPGGRVAVHARGGHTAVLVNGRFTAVWRAETLETPFVTLGDLLLFAMPGGGITAYRADGTVAWRATSAETSSNARRMALHAHPNGREAALALRRPDGQAFITRIAMDGTVLEHLPLGTAPRTPLMTPHGAGWAALFGTAVYLIGDEKTRLTTLPTTPGAGARLVSSAAGSLYLLADDRDETLLALDADGNIRWRASYPWRGLSAAPLLALDEGCAVWTLDLNGVLRAFSLANGELIGERTLYSGGDRSGNPRGLLLRAGGGRLLAGVGFLSLYLLDARAITDGACA